MFQIVFWKIWIFLFFRLRFLSLKKNIFAEKWTFFFNVYGFFQRHFKKISWYHSASNDTFENDFWWRWSDFHPKRWVTEKLRSHEPYSVESMIKELSRSTVNRFVARYQEKEARIHKNNNVWTGVVNKFKSFANVISTWLNSSATRSSLCATF